MMKKLLSAAIAASLSASVLAAPLGHPSIPPTQVHDNTHAGDFYQDVITRSQPAPVKEEPQEEHKAAVVAANECAPLWGGAGKSEQNEQAQAQARGDDQDENRRGVAVIPTADPCAGLGLARPLYGSLTVGEGVGIGAAVVAIGAAIGSDGGGGGGHHGSSGTTGTTK